METFDAKKFDELLMACADANYDCGAFIKGMSDDPFPVLVDRACGAGKALRDYVTSVVEDGTFAEEQTQ